MKTKYADRLEKVRKARSLNDVISIVQDIAKDVARHKKITAQVATAATKNVETEELTVDHTATGPSKLKRPGGKKTKIKVGQRMAGIKLEEFKAPPVKEILEHSSLLHELHENQHALEAAEAMIRQSFSRAAKQGVALKGLAALRKEVDNTLLDAMEMLQMIGSKHLPPVMANLSSALFDFILEHIRKDRYDDINQHIFVVMHETEDTAAPVPKTKGPSKIKVAPEFQFSAHFVIENLETMHGFRFPKYDLVITGIVDRGLKMRFFLNGLPDFKPPGKYPIGAEIADENDLYTRATMLLAHNDVVTQFDTKPMPLNTKSAKHHGFDKIKDVKKVSVVDDQLRITLQGAATKEKIHRVEVEVRSLLNAAVGNLKRKRSVILPKLVKNSSGENVLQFILVPDLPATPGKKEYDINVTKLNELKDLLDLPDDVVTQIKTALKHRV